MKEDERTGSNKMKKEQSRKLNQLKDAEKRVVMKYAIEIAKGTEQIDVDLNAFWIR